MKALKFVVSYMFLMNWLLQDYCQQVWRRKNWLFSNLSTLAFLTLRLKNVSNRG